MSTAIRVFTTLTIAPFCPIARKAYRIKKYRIADILSTTLYIFIVSNYRSHFTKMNVTLIGPCTPTTRTNSISAVLDGPEI